MIEVTLRDYLIRNLENIPVLFEKPKQKPATYVLIHGIDSGVINHIQADTFSFTNQMLMPLFFHQHTIIIKNIIMCA